MSWLRIEGKMPYHPKIAQLSDAAFRLTVTAWAWCVELRTDGKLPKRMVPALTRAPQSKHLERVVRELVEAELWHDRAEYFEIHGFLDYNMSAAQYDAKAKAGASGGRAKAAAGPGKSLAGARPLPQQVAGSGPSKTLADSESDSESEISVSQIQGPDRSEGTAGILPNLTQDAENYVISGPRDRCRMAFEPVSPEANALFEAWRQSSGKTNAKLDGKGRELFERLASEAVTVDQVHAVVCGAKLDSWARETAKLAPSAILGSDEQRRKFIELGNSPPPSKARRGQCGPQPNSGWSPRVINE